MPLPGIAGVAGAASAAITGHIQLRQPQYRHSLSLGFPRIRRGMCCSTKICVPITGIEGILFSSKRNNHKLIKGI